MTISGIDWKTCHDVPAHSVKNFCRLYLPNRSKFEQTLLAIGGGPDSFGCGMKDTILNWPTPKTFHAGYHTKHYIFCTRFLPQSIKCLTSNIFVDIVRYSHQVGFMFIPWILVLLEFRYFHASTCLWTHKIRPHDFLLPSLRRSVLKAPNSNLLTALAAHILGGFEHVSSVSSLFGTTLWNHTRQALYPSHWCLVDYTQMLM